MTSAEQQIEGLLAKEESAPIRVRTLGNFQIWRVGQLVSSKDWGREAAIQLFQFLVTYRHRKALHKEQIIDRIWSETDPKAGQQNFKVALHGANKALEPQRPSRKEPQFILRQGLTYQLNLEDIWIDAEALDHYVALGHQLLGTHQEGAKRAYREAIRLYQGPYLPNRLYEDWSSEERERIQLLALSAMVSLSELLMQENPMESVRLAQEALLIDDSWEDAYRIQMQAYLTKGNRPMALKTYQQCERVLEEEFGIRPLPETRSLLQHIKDL